MRADFSVFDLIKKHPFYYKTLYGLIIPFHLVLFEQDSSSGNLRQFLLFF